MKKHILVFLVSAAAVSALLTSCRQEALSPESIITVDAMEQNDFDKWLDVNFVHPYNIEFKYRYENNETDLDYYSVPAVFENAVIMAHLVKYLCIDSYDEVAGALFTCKYFPKEFFLMGEWEYKNNGVYTLGTAEGGKKIILMGINYLPDYMKTTANLNHYYLKTIHHEFTHILNQNVDFPILFEQVSGSSQDGYVNDGWSSSDYNDNLKKGFITKYARSSSREDFAEMMALYVTNSAEWWEGQMKEAETEGVEDDGRSRIETKLQYVRSYMDEAFGIDIDRLRSVILRRQQEVMAGQVDLTNLDI